MKLHFATYVFLLNCFLGFSQSNTEYNYNYLSDLFAKDVSLINRKIDTYADAKLKSSSIYSGFEVFKLQKHSTSSGRIDKILVIVNSTIYNQVSDKIHRYCYDINYVYGCNVVLVQILGANHNDIKKMIGSYLTDLDGVVLIGDIPTAWFQISNDHDKYGYAEWPCDLYYMDTDGVWADLDNDGIFDSHTGNVRPEIFIGRISTANMGTILAEKTGLENYLDKNHMFWIGQYTVSKKYGLTYTDKDWAMIDDFKTDIKHIYGESNFDSVSYKGDISFGKQDYLRRLSNNRYEFVQLACHSSFDHHVMSGGSIMADEIFKNGTEAIGYNLFCCSGCRWTSTNASSTQGFLAGNYIYNTKNSGLVAVGSTKTGSMLNFESFYRPLGEGNAIGIAMVEWWNDACGTDHSNQEVYWHYGMSIIGDPMVNFKHCMNTKCNSQISLNTFDTANESTIRYYLSKDKISISPNSNYTIPNDKHVIYNAPNVVIGNNFICNKGGTFEIMKDGCRSNCP